MCYHKKSYNFHIIYSARRYIDGSSFSIKAELLCKRYKTQQETSLSFYYRCAHTPIVMDMMSVYPQPDGSLYDEPSVENFHKPQIGRAGSHQELNVNVAYHPGSSAAVPQSLPLSTPDLLTSIGNSLLTTTQSNSPSQFGVRHQVTAEQEMYAQGFIDELRGLHQSDTIKPSVSSMSLIGDVPRSVVHPTTQAGLSGVGIDTTSGFSNSHSLESVAQTYVTATRDYINISAPHTESTSAFGASTSHNYVTNSYPSPMFSMYTPSIDTYGGYVTAGQPNVPGGVMPGGAMPPQMVKELQRVVPADMKTQEQMKVERKKARNRIAASKCRMRRLQRESELQSKVKLLKDHNQELNNEVSELKEQINNLKRALVQHMQGGCQVSVPEGYSLSPN